MSRTQWVPAWLEGEQLEWALVQELRRSYPAAADVAVDRVTVLRREVVLQERWAEPEESPPLPPAIDTNNPIVYNTSVLQGGRGGFYC